MKRSIIITVDTEDKEVYTKAKKQLNDQLLRSLVEDTGGNQCEITRRTGLSRSTVRKILKEVYTTTGKGLRKDLWVQKGNPF